MQGGRQKWGGGGEGSLTCRGQHGSCEVQLHHLVSEVGFGSWREREANLISIFLSFEIGIPQIQILNKVAVQDTRRGAFTVITNLSALIRRRTAYNLDSLFLSPTFPA